MIENIAILTGVFSMVLAFMSIVAILLLKKNVSDILSKDAIIFDKNLEIKKATLTKCLKMVDDLEFRGKVLSLNPEFIDKAKAYYNELLCVVHDINVANEFYNIALNTDYAITKNVLANFKMMCRKDIGLKAKFIKPKKNEEAEANKTIVKTAAFSSSNQTNYNASTNSNANAPKQKVQEVTTPVRPVAPNTQTPHTLQRPNVPPTNTNKQ